MAETKICVDCKQEFPVNERGCLIVPFFDVHSTVCKRCGTPLIITYEGNGRLSYHCPNHHLRGIGSEYYGYSQMRCPRCNEERRKKNRQAYPPCPMCSTPTRVGGFLREYRGYELDIIRVCCKNCIPQFEACSESEQLTLLRQAMVRAYGETAVIYALQYDDTFTYHHIGRTKRLTRRMADYRHDWHREIKDHHVLEEIPFGPLSIERESRWILHALKHGQPIDNFDLFTVERHGASTDQEEHHARELRLKEELIVAIADFEPLTAPYAVVRPLIRRMTNTIDTDIVHWFVELYERNNPR